MVTLLASTVVTGCSSGYNGARLAVIGDSITGLEQPQLSAALDGRYTIDYVFRYGISIAPATALLRADLAANGRPGALIENLGTNDALTGRKVTGPPPTLAPVVLAAAGIPCVVLTTVSLRADERGGSDVAATIDDEIVRLHHEDPRRYPVVDWNGFVELLGPADLFRYIQADHIHETPLGAHWLVQADASALATCKTTRAA